MFQNMNQSVAPRGAFEKVDISLFLLLLSFTFLTSTHYGLEMSTHYDSFYYDVNIQPETVNWARDSCLKNIL